MEVATGWTTIGLSLCRSDEATTATGVTSLTVHNTLKKKILSIIPTGLVEESPEGSMEKEDIDGSIEGIDSIDGMGETAIRVNNRAAR